MDLIRALRILRHRWLMVSVIVVGTAGVAVATATYRNNQVQPLNRAEAPITFISDVAEMNDSEGALLDIIQAQLDEARARAIQANADLLDDPANEVVIDATLGRLTFIARHSDVDTAVTTASEMRRRLLTRQPVNMETQIEEQLAALSEQMDQVRGQLDELDAQNSLPPEISSRRERLTTLLGQLESQALTLEQQVLVPPEGEEARSPEELQAELDEVNSAIAEVAAELQELPGPPEEFSVEMTERRALERQFRELEASYQELLLQRAELSGPPVVELVDVFDETADPIPRRTAAAVALFLGGGLALLVLLLVEKVKRPLWFPADVPQVPFIGSVPGRPPTPLPWYIQTGDSHRKASIQTLRSSIRARARENELVLGLASSGVDARSLETLGTDLALSFASTRSTTALVDASFGPSSEMPELVEYDLSLTEIVQESPSGDQVGERVEKAMAQSRSVHPHLFTVAGGEQTAVASDVLAGPQVGHLFEALREMTDVVIVISGEVSSPATRAAVDRADVILVATTPGRTTQGMLTSFSEEMSVRQVDVLAVTLPRPFAPRLLRVLRWMGKRLAPGERSSSGEAPSVSRPVLVRWAALLDLWRKYWPRPSHADSDQYVEKKPPKEPVHQESPVDTVAPVVRVVGPDRNMDVGLLPVKDDPGMMLKALDSSDPEQQRAEAQEFLVGWVTKVVEAREGTGLHPDTVRGVSEVGFLPLSTWKKNPSLGSRIRQEWRHALGKGEASRLENLILKSLNAGDDSTSLDRWASRRYFGLHALESGWEPTVWHVTSSQGTVSALIAATRLDSRRIERFVDGVVIRAIERLARRQRRKLAGSDAQNEELERQIEDVRALGLALAWLMDGSHEDSRLWYPTMPKDDQPQGWKPDWSHGIKANIAPLQKLGILAVPVLSDEELNRLDPTA